MENEKKRISIMVPTYNEQENVEPLTEAIIAEFKRSLPEYDYDILFIDNCSTDETRPKLRAICARYPFVRAIFNARNFGQFNSPYWGICQTTGDCTIPLCADFQDPVEMIPVLVKKWEEGARVVCAVKTASRENRLVRFLRTCYYKLIRRMSSVEQIEHFTGFGLYDRSFVDVLRTLDDPAPFIRGIIAELGFSVVKVPYTQQKRRAGKTHNNFNTLYDAAMLSFTTYTKTPIRFLFGLGCWLFALSVAGGLACGVIKIVSYATHHPISLHGFWVIPVIGFFGALNMIFTGVIGEYVLTLRSKIMRRPLVIEQERLNFDEEKTDD